MGDDRMFGTSRTNKSGREARKVGSKPRLPAPISFSQNTYTLSSLQHPFMESEEEEKKRCIYKKKSHQYDGSALQIKKTKKEIFESCDIALPLQISTTEHPTAEMNNANKAESEMDNKQELNQVIIDVGSQTKMEEQKLNQRFIDLNSKTEIAVECDLSQLQNEELVKAQDFLKLGLPIQARLPTKVTELYELMKKLDVDKKSVDDYLNQTGKVAESLVRGFVPNMSPQDTSMSLQERITKYGYLLFLQDVQTQFRSENPYSVEMEIRLDLDFDTYCTPAFEKQFKAEIDGHLKKNNISLENVFLGAKKGSIIALIKWLKDEASALICDWSPALIRPYMDVGLGRQIRNWPVGHPVAFEESGIPRNGKIQKSELKEDGRLEYTIEFHDGGKKVCDSNDRRLTSRKHVWRVDDHVIVGERKGTICKITKDKKWVLVRFAEKLRFLGFSFENEEWIDYSAPNMERDTPK